MKAFVLTLSLRVIRASVADLDAEAHEPGDQPGEAVLRIVTPGRTVIAEDASGQAVTTKSTYEQCLYGLGLLVRADAKADQKARVVVQDGEGEAGPRLSLDRSLEVH